MGSHSRLLFLLLALLAVAGCASPRTSQRPAALAAHTPSQQAQSLWVAMYPYVPRLQQMEDALSAAWRARHPDIALNFFTSEQWDGGYDTPVPANADLFVFDAINFNWFQANGWLVPLQPGEVMDKDDFVPYVIEPLLVQGKFVAIPLLGCTDMLFYRKGDAAMEQATTYSRLTAVIGQCPYVGTVAPQNQGLMMDLAGKTTNAATYISATERLSGQWPVPQPTQPSQLYPPAISNLRGLLTSSSYLNAAKDQEPQYVRSAWFSQGHGRGVIAFTESMSAMAPATLDSIDFRVLPLSDTTSRPLFYSDLIGINQKIYSTSKRALLVELANLLASSQTMVAGTGPDASGVPQYLMPVRPSVFRALGAQFPMYQRMQSIVQSVNPILFTLDANSKPWLAAMAGTIRSTVQANYACGCDFGAGPIWNQSDANRVCPSVCGGHGGWLGSWTTTQQGVESVCGCRACAIGP